VQNIEFDTFAPDTVEEIISSRRLLEIWTAKASLRHKDESTDSMNDDDLVLLGRRLLSGKEEVINGMRVLGENMENTKRDVLILKPYKAYHAYGDMLLYYAMKNLMSYMNLHPKARFSSLCKNLKDGRKRDWVNLGGQIMQKNDLKKLRTDIGSGVLNTWDDIHLRYDDLWAKYAVDKQKHAFAILCEIFDTDNLTLTEWESALDKAVTNQEFICDQVYITRKKDYDNPFRQATYRNMDEMTAAIGTIDENSFIIHVKQETEDFKLLAEEIRKRK